MEGDVVMSRELFFASHFDNGSAVRLRMDWRQLRDLPEDGIVIPAFEYHGDLPRDLPLGFHNEPPFEHGLGADASLDDPVRIESTREQ
jgi:hypothetical protein